MFIYHRPQRALTDGKSRKIRPTNPLTKLGFSMIEDGIVNRLKVLPPNF